MAASKRLYEESPEKKKEAMTAYNEKYKSDINLAMRENYHGNPEKKNLKKLAMSLYYTETSSLTAVPEKTCPICEKHFCHQKDMQRHVSTVTQTKKHLLHVRFVTNICITK